ncbi:hypothetical protein B0H14DRAFT_2659452, partial [Mycena olivaceomarginata]
MSWVHTERRLEEFYNCQTRIDEWEDCNALEPRKHTVQLLWIALGKTLDWVSMEKNELVEYEAFMRGQEHAQNERANDNSQYLVAVAKEDQMGVDEITLDSAAEHFGMGIHRVCDEPEVPLSAMNTTYGFLCHIRSRAWAGSLCSHYSRVSEAPYQVGSYPNLLSPLISLVLPGPLTMVLLVILH